MLPTPDQQRILSKALSTGADYAEIFCEETTRNTITQLDGVIQSALSGRDFGLSLRVFRGLRCAYGYTNDLSASSLDALAEQVSASLGQATQEQPVKLAERRLQNAHPVQIAPSSIGSREKAEILRETYAGALAAHPQVKGGTLTYRDIDQKVSIATTDGSVHSDRRVYTRLTVNILASDGSQTRSGQKEVLKLAGFETLREINPGQVGQQAAAIALSNLQAKPCPSGSMPVVIAGGAGGTFLHEACGHALEASAIAQGSSFCCGRLGQRIASEKITVYDSGLLPNAWGSINIDDEGIEAQNTLLIERGILKAYLVDRLNGRRLNMPPTGSGRKQSYRYLPTSRMRNTYIAPGADSESDLFSGIEQGLYVKQIGGGNTNPATSEFSFSVTEGYLIRHGMLAGPVSGGTLIGKASEVLLDIDLVCADLGFGYGLCGASSGLVPVGDGAPSLRIQKLTVGGAL